MEGPLLVLKSWMLTAVAIWIYQRWFQRVAPRDVAFEAFCAGRPVVGAIAGAGLHQASVLVALSSALGKPRACVATLGGYPWPHYRLELALEESRGAVLLRVIKAEVLRTRERELPALASLLRGVLNGLPEDAKVSAWLHRGAFNNGLVDSPPGGWSIERGSERRPKLVALREAPLLVAQLAQSEPELARTVTAAPHFAFENQTPRLAP
jgi:hypothetical protein